MGNQNFARKLKKARKDAGFTQKDIFEKLEISQSTFSSWEIGKSEPSAETLIKLCELYGLKGFSYFNEGNESGEGAPEDGEIRYTTMEEALVKAYRALDSHGQRLVGMIVEEEYKRLGAGNKGEAEGKGE